MSASRLRPYLGPLIALLVVMALGAGAVYAAIPNDGTYFACLTKSTGAIRVINHPKVKCAKGQRLIKWNEQGRQGAQGPQGPAGPADWNAIPNKPAGFADGVDDGGFVSEVQPGAFTAEQGFATAVKVFHPVGTDVDLTIIPAPGTNVEVTDEFFEREPNGLLVYRLEVTNTDSSDPVTFRARTRVYNTGIAPAAFKKALAKVRVTVTKAKEGR